MFQVSLINTLSIVGGTVSQPLAQPLRKAPPTVDKDRVAGHCRAHSGRLDA